MFGFITDSPLFAEARKARFRPPLFVQLLVFWIVCLVVETVAGIAPGIYAGLEVMRAALSAGRNPTTEQLQQLITEKMQALSGDETYILLSLFGMTAVLVLVPLYCRFIEKRSFSSMGFRRGGLVKYGIGLLAGLLMAGAMFGLTLLSGSITVSAGAFSTGRFLLFLLAFLLQGAAEEVLLRGYFTVSAANSTGPIPAVLLSSLFFALLHFGNNGIGLISFLNLFLFGLFMALFLLKTNSIFAACALHGIWNFAEGCIFGLPVSGMSITTSLLASSSLADRTLTNGGAFGPEGGAVVTVILLLSLTLLLYWPQKKKATPPPRESV